MTLEPAVQVHVKPDEPVLSSLTGDLRYSAVLISSLKLRFCSFQARRGSLACSITARHRINIHYSNPCCRSRSAMTMATGLLRS